MMEIKDLQAREMEQKQTSFIKDKESLLTEEIEKKGKEMQQMAVEL